MTGLYERNIQQTKLRGKQRENISPKKNHIREEKSLSRLCGMENNTIWKGFKGIRRDRKVVKKGVRNQLHLRSGKKWTHLYKYLHS